MALELNEDGSNKIFSHIESQNSRRSVRWTNPFECSLSRQS